MKLGILAPLPQELNTIFPERIVSGACANLSEHIVICLTGIGEKNTRTGFKELCKHQVELFVSWGTAAGLSPQAQAGDLVLPDYVVANGQKYGTCNSFNEKLISHLPDTVNLHRQAIAETNKVLASVADKKQLFSTSDCLAADMESGTLAALATENELPFTAIRSISDSAESPLPKALLASFDQGAFQLRTFLTKAFLSPGEWWGITKMARDFKKARKTMIIAGEIIKTQHPAWM